MKGTEMKLKLFMKTPGDRHKPVDFWREAGGRRQKAALAKVNNH